MSGTLNIQNEAYITHLYQDMLGRQPDGGGLDYWATRPKPGRRDANRAGLRQSTEYATDFVNRMNLTLLNGAATAASQTTLVAGLTRRRNERKKPWRSRSSRPHRHSTCSGEQIRLGSPSFTSRCWASRQCQRNRRVGDVSADAYASAGGRRIRAFQRIPFGTDRQLLS